MDIAELIEIALANSDERRVEVAALEPATVKMEAVGALTQIVTELVENAISFSEPEDRVRVTGLPDQGDYLISISDRGVGIPEHLMSELNRVLEDPDYDSNSPFGISLVAHLAVRHDIQVRLVPGAPGTTARVTVPAQLVTEPGAGEPAEERSPEEKPRPSTGHRLPPRQPVGENVFASAGEVDESIDLTRFERAHRPHSGVVAMTEDARRRAEAFLEKVFTPLAERPGVAERRAPRPHPEPNGTQNHSEERPPSARPETTSHDQPADQSGTVTNLRVRVPGENYSPVEDHASTVAAEAAIDIRSALSRYTEGRRSAEREGDRGNDHPRS